MREGVALAGEIACCTHYMKVYFNDILTANLKNIRKQTPTHLNTPSDHTLV